MPAIPPRRNLNTLEMPELEPRLGSSDHPAAQCRSPHRRDGTPRRRGRPQPAPPACRALVGGRGDRWRAAGADRRPLDRRRRPYVPVERRSARRCAPPVAAARRRHRPHPHHRRPRRRVRRDDPALAAARRRPDGLGRSRCSRSRHPPRRPAWPGDRQRRGVGQRHRPGSSASTPDPTAIASITKLVTALVVLDEMPLARRRAGTRVPLQLRRQHRVLELPRTAASPRSTCPSAARSPQYQLLEGMLIGSAEQLRRPARRQPVAVRRRLRGRRERVAARARRRRA